jgi:hypothetical protein
LQGYFIYFLEQFDGKLGGINGVLGQIADHGTQLKLGWGTFKNLYMRTTDFLINEKL